MGTLLALKRLFIKNFASKIFSTHIKTPATEMLLMTYQTQVMFFKCDCLRLFVASSVHGFWCPTLEEPHHLLFVVALAFLEEA